MSLFVVNTIFLSQEIELNKVPQNRECEEIFGCFWVPMPYQKKTLTTIAVSTAASMRAKTVNANPTMSVTTFAEDI